MPARLWASGSATAFIACSRERTLTLQELEREYVLEVLRETNGLKARAAEMLGIDRKTLYRKLEEYRAEGLLPEPLQAASDT